MASDILNNAKCLVAYESQKYDNIVLQVAKHVLANNAGDCKAKMLRRVEHLFFFKTKVGLVHTASQLDSYPKMLLGICSISFHLFYYEDSTH